MSADRLPEPAAPVGVTVGGVVLCPGCHTYRPAGSLDKAADGRALCTECRGEPLDPLVADAEARTTEETRPHGRARTQRRARRAR